MGETQFYGHFVADLIIKAEPASIDRALLLVDAQRSDVVLVRGIRTAISRTLKGAGATYQLKKVKPRPAAEEDGLQIADMIAGAMVDWLEGRGNYLAQVEGNLRLWRYRPK